MRVSNGSDIVSIERFARSMERGGERLLQRLFSPRELALSGKRKSDPAYWAVRFSAKEALAKALGTGIGQAGIKWQEIEIIKRPSGQPELQLKGRAAELYKEQGWSASSLSLSHDTYALATVVLIKMH